jgi:hypothetical protein
MTGFDNGTLQSGVFFQAKQFGSILRGFGPPVPQAGVVGDLYLDVQTFNLYEKRLNDDTDPWGHFLFVVPTIYQSSLKWFTASQIGDDIGVPGDYALLWAGFGNYGMQPSIFGPKGPNSWPENGNGPGTVMDPAFAGFALPVGLVDEGTPAAFSSSTQLVVVGLSDEFILAIPSPLPIAGSPVLQQGLRGFPVNVAVTLNPLLTAEDGHAI